MKNGMTAKSTQCVLVNNNSSVYQPLGAQSTASMNWFYPSLCVVIASNVCLVLALGTWFGVFFGAAYPEVVVHEKWKPTLCSIQAQNESRYTCCETSGHGCSSCYRDDPTCSSLHKSLQPGQSGSCCNGRYCCGMCCSTCRSCSSGKYGSSCSTYQCNCYCCSSVSDQAATVTCKQCYKPLLVVRFPLANSNTTFATSKFQKDCREDYSCVQKLFEQYSLNTTGTCYYNPANPNGDDVKWSTAYSAGPMVGVGIVSAWLLLTICCGCLSFVACVFSVVQNFNDY